MAKLPQEVTATINNFKQQALNVLEEATAIEFIIFGNLGESETTIIYMDEMNSTAGDAESLYNRLSTLQLQIAKSQPTASTALLELMNNTIILASARIPALSRSIEEVKQELNLS